MTSFRLCRSCCGLDEGRHGSLVSEVGKGAHRSRTDQGMDVIASQPAHDKAGVGIDVRAGPSARRHPRCSLRRHSSTKARPTAQAEPCSIEARRPMQPIGGQSAWSCTDSIHSQVLAFPMDARTSSPDWENRLRRSNVGIRPPLLAQNAADAYGCSSSKKQENVLSACQSMQVILRTTFRYGFCPPTKPAVHRRQCRRG